MCIMKRKTDTLTLASNLFLVNERVDFVEYFVYGSMYVDNFDSHDVYYI